MTAEDNVRHVYPVGPDIPEHETSGWDCWCHPKVEKVGMDGYVIVHKDASEAD